MKDLVPLKVVSVKDSIHTGSKELPKDIHVRIKLLERGKLVTWRTYFL